MSSKAKEEAPNSAPSALRPKKRWQISFGKDSLINNALPYYTLPLLYVVVLYCLQQHISLMYIVLFLFVVVPFCDEYFEHDLRNPTPEEERRMENELRFKLPLYVCLFMDWILTFYTIKKLVDGSYSPLNQAVIVFVVGLLGVANINTAHELGHKVTDSIDYFFSHLTIAKNLLLYWVPEHNQVHHVWVSTPLDPATSRKNQPFYEFLPKSAIGTWTQAWRIERERLEREAKKNGQNTFTVFTPRNRMIWYTLNNFVLPYIVYKQFSSGTDTIFGSALDARGFWAVIYFMLFAFESVFFLEDINYIEHYGLQRKLLRAPNVYEKVSPMHSWNAPHRLSNYLLFKLQRHSDHHANAMKPYQILVSYESSPRMPNGYALMIVLALFPPVWYRVMNLELEMFQSGRRDEKVAAQVQSMVRTFLNWMTAFLVLVTYISVKLDYSA